MRLKEEVKYVESLWKEEHLDLLKAWRKGMGGDLHLALEHGRRCSGTDGGDMVEGSGGKS